MDEEAKEAIKDIAFDNMPVPMGVIFGKKQDRDGDVYFSEWEFYRKDDIWKLDFLKNIIEILELKYDSLLDEHNKKAGVNNA